MHVQLRGDGADGPFLGVVVAQDLRLGVGLRSPWGFVLRPGMANTAATAITATQKPLPKLRQAGTTAPMTVRRRPPGRHGRGTRVARDRHRADGNHTTRRRRG